MRESFVQRRVLLKLGGAGFVGGLMTTSPAVADGDGEDEADGQINNLSGFETPLPVADNSHRLQLISPTNQLTIDVETDDTIDIVFEWDNSITVNGSNFSISGSIPFTNSKEDIGQHRAIFREADAFDSEFDKVVLDRLTLGGLDTDSVEPGNELTVTVSVRQADSPEDTDDFEDVVTAVDDGSFDADETTEATFEVTQGTLISTNDEATTDLDLAASTEHTIAFDIDQLRDESAGGTPAGPAKGLIISYFIDNDDGLDFDLADDDVTFGGAATDLDLEVVKSREIPGIGQVLLEIANGETLEDDADLEIGDTVTVELSGLDTAAIDPDEFDESGSIVEVGLHGAATFDPIVDESIAPDRGAYTIDAVDFAFGDQTSPTEIEDWHDLDEIRNDLDSDYILVSNLDEDTKGYSDIVADITASEFTENVYFSEGETETELAQTPLNEIVSADVSFDIGIVDEHNGIIERANDSSFESVEITYATDERFVGFKPIGYIDNEFRGKFDGNGHEIDGLTIDRANEDNVGLFGAIGEGTVLTNVGLTNVEVTGRDDVGGLVGLGPYAPVTIAHSYVTGDVAGKTDVGGLIGSVGEGSIVENSYATADVAGETQVGGLAGFTEDNTVTTSYATGTVTVDDRRVGGLIGFTGSTDVSMSYATGDVNAETADEVGGLVGDNIGTISASYATGTVTGGSSVGGLVGDHFGEINTSFADSTVEATADNAQIGGLVGTVQSDQTITQSYALGSVEAENASSLGGLVGESNGEVSNSYAAVAVQGSGADVGGFIGELEGSSPIDSYWDTEVSGQDDSSGAEGLLTDEMTGDTAQNNMSGFDFDDVWDLQVEPDDYPTLQAIQQDEPTPNFVVTILEPAEGDEVRQDNQLEVTAEIVNTGGELGTQTIELTAPVQNTHADVELARDDETQVEFIIPEADVEGTFDITVESEDTTDSVSVTAVDPCFIATAAYNTPQAAEIDVLRDFRDSVLDKHAVGRALIRTYYATSPPVANWIRQTKERRQMVRKYVVDPLVRTVDRLPSRSE